MKKLIFLTILTALFIQTPLLLVSAQGKGTVPTGSTGSAGTVPTSQTDNTAPPANQPPSTPPSTSQFFSLQNPLKVNSVGEIIQAFIVIATYLLIILAVLALIWTGFQYVVSSAKGEVDKIKELHERLLWIVVGVAIVIGARVIVQVVINTISATGTVSPSVIQSANDAVRIK